MKTLDILLSYAAGNFSPSSPQLPTSGVSAPFPFRVMDAHGGILAEGVVNSQRPARVELNNAQSGEVVFVRLVWPTGKAVTQAVHFAEGQDAEVRFTDEALGQDEWAKWAMPRVPYARPSTSWSNSKGENKYSDVIDRFKNVWLRLWTHTTSGWELTDGMPRSGGEGNAVAKQMELSLGPGAHLLQIGGAQMPWVFVSLPGNGPCRVFLTPNAAADAMNLPLKIVVTGFRPEAETLVEFLSRDALRAADSVGQFEPVAARLLQDKVEDAVSAIAGAYYLLRIGRWRETPTQWFDNLYDMFPWSADAALIRCAVTLRKGLHSRDDTARALQQLGQCFARGVPLFEEAHRLQVEAHSLLNGLLFPSSAEPRRSNQHLVPARPEAFEAILQNCRTFTSARAWTGPSYSYFGGAPDQPSSERLRGAPPALSSVSSSSRGRVMFSLSEAMRTESDGSTAKRAKRQPSVTYLKDL